MEKRVCTNCKESLPLTEEFFYKVKTKRGSLCFRGECKVCGNERRKYNHALAKVRKEQAEKDKWMDEFRGKKFICKQCGTEKSFNLMRLDSSNKRVHSWCKKCYSNKSREYSQMSKANAFVKVLKERQERRRRQNDE
jgi:hypothetical protein